MHWIDRQGHFPPSWKSKKKTGPKSQAHNFHSHAQHHANSAPLRVVLQVTASRALRITPDHLRSIPSLRRRRSRQCAVRRQSGDRPLDNAAAPSLSLLIPHTHLSRRPRPETLSVENRSNVHPPAAAAACPQPPAAAARGVARWADAARPLRLHAGGSARVLPLIHERRRRLLRPSALPHALQLPRHARLLLLAKLPRRRRGRGRGQAAAGARAPAQLPARARHPRAQAQEPRARGRPAARGCCRALDGGAGGGRASALVPGGACALAPALALALEPVRPPALSRAGFSNRHGLAGGQRKWQHAVHLRLARAPRLRRPRSDDSRVDVARAGRSGRGGRRRACAAGESKRPGAFASQRRLRPRTAFQRRAACELGYLAVHVQGRVAVVESR